MMKANFDDNLSIIVNQFWFFEFLKSS